MREVQPNRKTALWKTIVAPLTVLCVAYFSIFRGYTEPGGFYWDENYHIASAQKYLHGVFFMEPHPPLGKLLIAAGEWLTQANEITNQFIASDYSRSHDEAISFKGYRLFPTLLGWLSPLVLFYVLKTFLRRDSLAVMGGLMLAFDNAFILQVRGAMLEGPQIFFMLIALWAFAKLISNTSRYYLWSSLMGAALGAAIATKYTSVFFVLLLGIFGLWKSPSGRSPVKPLVLSVVSALLCFFVTWQIHFSLSKNVIKTLPGNGFYEASPGYREALSRGISLSDFPVMFRDSIHFFNHYQKGVPHLNLCLPDETGSPAFLWPFGSRSINYKWTRSGDVTFYLYLVANPAVWFFGLAGLLLGSIVLGSRCFLSTSVAHHQAPLTVLLLIYLLYMGSLLGVTRALYLYHYLIPLILSVIIGFLALPNILSIMSVRLDDQKKTLLIGVVTIAATGFFLFFRPFTYAHPLTDAQVKRRALWSLWDIRCAECDSTLPFARSTGDPQYKPFPKVSISGLEASQGWQEWGEPSQGHPVEGDVIQIAGKNFSSGIGVHAKSSLSFPLRGRYRTFLSSLGVPDYVGTKEGQNATVVFEVWGDGQLLWRSETISKGMLIEGVEIDVRHVDELQLRVEDDGDGNTNDHAVWVNPKLLDNEASAGVGKGE